MKFSATTDLAERPQVIPKPQKCNEMRTMRLNESTSPSVITISIHIFQLYRLFGKHEEMQVR